MSNYWAVTYITITRSYKCSDNYNKLVPTGEYSGVSAGIASLSSVSATVTWKYKSITPNNDVCEVKTCTMYVDSTSQSVFCEQNVGAGTYQSFSKAFNVNQGTHTTHAVIKANGLLVIKEQIINSFEWHIVGIVCFG